jgi:hypothetical protein
MNSELGHANVFNCVLNIHHALSKHDLYKDNYHSLMQLPMFQRMKNKNRQLKKRIHKLKQVNEQLMTRITTTTKSSCSCGKNCACNDDEEIVKIQGMMKVYDLTQDDDDDDDDESNANVTENPEIVVIKSESCPCATNIVYEVVEEEEDDDEE